MFWALVIDRLLRAGRCLVLIVGFSALVLTGAFAAQRAVEPPTPPETVQGDNGPDELGVTPGSEEPTDGMVPGSRPCTEPAAYLQAALIPSGSDSQPKLHLPQIHEQVFHHGRNDRSVLNNDRRGTVARVSGLLAHRFTLVGARPSGTS